MILYIIFTKFLLFLFKMFIVLLVLKSRLWEAIIVFHTYETHRTDNGTMLLLVTSTELGLVISSNNHQFQGHVSPFGLHYKSKNSDLEAHMTMCYTPAFLQDVGLQTHHCYHKFYINPEVRYRIISLGIRRRPANKTYRRSQAGKNLFHKTERMVMDWNFPFIIRTKIAPRLHNLCQICRYKSTHKTGLTISHINARSTCNKINHFQEYITEVGIEICAITETWIKSDDSFTQVDIPPLGYMIF